MGSVAAVGYDGASARSDMMINRREVLLAGGAMAAAGLTGWSWARADSPTESEPENHQKPDKRGGNRRVMRTITYNVLSCSGWAAKDADTERLERARNRQDPAKPSQIPRRIALELALYDPDIVSFQEAPAEAIVAEIAEALHMRYAYFPGGVHGAILTRYRIVDTQNRPTAGQVRSPGLFSRHWCRAVLDTDREELVFYGAHLHPGQADIRADEVTEMLAVMQKDLASDRSLLFQGDLNHQPDEPEYQRWIEAGLTDSFATKGVGQPLTILAAEPSRRIDYIWSHGPMAGRLRRCRVLYEGAFRTNLNDPGSFALSDHLPVLAEFERRD